MRFCCTPGPSLLRRQHSSSAPSTRTLRCGLTAVTWPGQTISFDPLKRAHHTPLYDRCPQHKQDPHQRAHRRDQTAGQSSRCCEPVSPCAPAQFRVRSPRVRPPAAGDTALAYLRAPAHSGCRCGGAPPLRGTSGISGRRSGCGSGLSRRGGGGEPMSEPKSMSPGAGSRLPPQRREL